MRLLLVEDDEMIAETVLESMRRLGYAIDWAADGRAAELSLANGVYDLVLLDLGLPKLDGLTVLKLWRGAGRRFPVLVLTARGTWTERVEGIDSGADDYLPKPFEMEELIARLRALLRRSAGQPSPIFKSGDVALDNDTVLAPGMVFMIHPNQYLPEIGYLLCGEPVLMGASRAEPLTRQQAALAISYSSNLANCRARENQYPF